MHIIPKYYLRGFCIDKPDSLWVYEKGKNIPPRCQNLDKVAKENGIYSEELEKYLADKIENPANETIRKIRNREPINPNEKEALSNYIYVLFKRVPRAFQRFQVAAPKIAEETKNQLYVFLDRLIKQNPKKSKIYETRRSEVKEITDELADNPDKETWGRAIRIFEDDRGPKFLAGMTWLFMVSKDQEIYITNDNPVFIHPRIGMNKINSELTFPISSDVTLWIVPRWEYLNLSYVEAKPAFIKEANRRIVFNASRFFYSGKKRDWIPNIMRKKTYPTSLLQDRNCERTPRLLL